MRTETDTFYDKDSGDKIEAFISGVDSNKICFSCAYPLLSIEKAREFFKQGLEMCEPEAAEQPDFTFIKEGDCE